MAYPLSLLFAQIVGMTGFEPATTRPPDVYSNRAELHPAKKSTAILASLFALQR